MRPEFVMTARHRHIHHAFRSVRRAVLFAAAALLLVGLAAPPARAGFPEDRERLKAIYAALADRPPRERVEPGPSLRMGDSGPRVAVLRRALESLGFDAPDTVSGTDDFFDAALEGAVLSFQRHVGIEDDGVVGPATLGVLNSYESFARDRIAQALSHHDWPTVGRYVIVNVAAAEAYAIEDGAIAIRSRAIVGTPWTRTPTFSAQALSITLNPAWTVPPGIAARKYDGRIFTVPPGPDNPLGKIRVDMPNRHLVFLHGTNEPRLFERRRRTFSSGCVRVEEIIPLARWLVGEDAWMEADADTRLQGSSTQRIALPEPIQVKIEYRLASVTPEGDVSYHPDHYGVLGKKAAPSLSTRNHDKDETIW